jgi:hypothetical protein
MLVAVLTPEDALHKHRKVHLAVQFHALYRTAMLAYTSDITEGQPQSYSMGPMTSFVTSVRALSPSFCRTISQQLYGRSAENSSLPRHTQP